MKCGDRLGNYELLEELGRGGMGVVFKARELSLNRDVALKVLLPGFSSEADYVERFRREAQIVAALRHPNIISILSYGEAEGRYYFAMEYVAGRDLGQLLKERITLPIEEALSITAQIARALDEASERGVTHRDIKPSNIMIDETGHAMIADFGIARFAAHDELTRTGAFFSTPEYAAPEVVTGGAVDVRSDIYSLGAVLYKTVSGEPPVSGDSAVAIMVKASTEGATPLSEMNSSLPAPLCTLVDSMLAVEPANRPQTAKDLLSAIRECEHALALDAGGQIDRTVAVAALPIGARRRRPRSLLLATSLAALFAALLTALLVVLPGITDGPADPDEPPDTMGLRPPPNTAVADVLPHPPAEAMVAAKVLGAVAAEPPPPTSTDPTGGVSATTVIALVPDKTPPVSSKLPLRPAVLVVVFGDEPMISLVRTQLASKFLDSDINVIPVTEIPVLRSKGQIGRIAWTSYEVKQFVPPSKAQVVVLAQIQKTGSSPLRYLGRVDHLTHARFSVQTLDTATGHSIHSGSAASIQFTILNMDENLQNAIGPVAEDVGTRIKEYWEQKRKETGTS